jgi:hypothetical protein
MSDERAFRFARSERGQISLHKDKKVALLAVCVAYQQAAGFRNYLDLRQFDCPHCAAPGFNSGWGFTIYTCGAEYCSDGSPSVECKKRRRAQP